MDENISPEPFLSERRKMRAPIQVTPSTSAPKEGFCTRFRQWVWRLSGLMRDGTAAPGAYLSPEINFSDIDDVETGSSGTIKLLSTGSKRVDTWPVDERNSGGVDTSDHPAGRYSRGMSFMPRHDKSEVNPFINRTMHLPWYLCVKMVITGSVLVPLRIALTMVNFLFMWIFASIVLAGLSENDMEKSFSRWRVFFKYPIGWCLRFQVFLFGFLWIPVKGKCATKEEAPIIVSNHVSPFEPFFLVSQTQATPVQRIEDARAPVIGKIQKAMQVIFVDRSNPASKKKCLQTIEARSDPDSRFPRVLVYPEGTCTNQRALITFKHGPFMPGRAVQPVIVRYRFWWLDPSFPAVSPSLLTLALRVMCPIWNCMEIEYLPVYVPSPEDREDPTLFAQHVQEYMSKSLGVPATQHAFEDVALQFQAMKLKLNPEDAVVEWSRVRRALDIDTTTAKEYLIVFFEMDTDKDGRLSLEEFCAPWQRKRDAAAERRRRLAEEKERAAYGGNGDSTGDGKSWDVPTWLQRQQDPPEDDDIETTSGKKPPRPGGTDALAVNVMHVDDTGGDYHSTGVEAGDGREGGKEEGKGESGDEEAAEGPGLLRKEEMERAYDILCGGEELDFKRFLTGLGILSGLAREGRTGLFKFIYSVLQGRRVRTIYRRDIVAFIRRLRPDVTQDSAEAILEKVENLGKGDPVEKEGYGSMMRLDKRGEVAGDTVVTRETFVAFAEQNGSIVSVYQAMLLNDILGVERDIAEFGLACSEDFGSLGVDTTELEKSLHGLVGPATLV